VVKVDIELCLRMSTSRLTFNYRELVACANAGRPHSNGSQFFITLESCDWLDKKNTISGKEM